MQKIRLFVFCKIQFSGFTTAIDLQPMLYWLCIVLFLIITEIYTPHRFR